MSFGRAAGSEWGSDDVGGVRRGDVRIEGADGGHDRPHAADELGDDEAGTDAGAIPANELENIRPMPIAGLAKLVELVKK